MQTKNPISTPADRTDRQWRLKCQIVAAISVFGILSADAGEAIGPKADDWEVGDPDAKLVEAERGSLTYKGRGGYRLISKAIVEIDPTKTYRISGLFRGIADQAEGNRYFGFVPLDEEGNQIQCSQVNFIEDTATELVADCNAGDKVVIVKEGKAWSIGPDFCIAFNADDSGSFADLPSKELSKAGIVEVAQIGEGYEVKLNSAIPQFYPAGTKVREHSAGPAGIYANIRKDPLAPSWKDVAGTVEPDGPPGATMNNWWRGTKKVRVVISGPGDGKEIAFSFKDVRIEEGP